MVGPSPRAMFPRSELGSLQIEFSLAGFLPAQGRLAAVHVHSYGVEESRSCRNLWSQPVGHKRQSAVGAALSFWPAALFQALAWLDGHLAPKVGSHHRMSLEPSSGLQREATF